MPHALPKMHFWRHTLSALGLELGAPLLIIAFAHIIQNCGGMEKKVYEDFQTNGQGNPVTWFLWIFSSNRPSANIYYSCLIYYIFEYILLVFVPAEIHYGPPTFSGYVPSYRKNGVICYFLSIIVMIALFIYAESTESIKNDSEFAKATLMPNDHGSLLLSFYVLWLKLIRGLFIDFFTKHFTAFIIATTVNGYLFTTYLYIRGMLFPYHKPDQEWTGNVIYDFYKGIEYYTPIGGSVNCKQFINCRVSMNQWSLLVLLMSLKDLSVNGDSQTNSSIIGVVTFLLQSPVFISAILQAVYLWKFFLWETGYFHTLDVMHDRCGFYIIWGCLCWVPCVYTFHTQWLLAQNLSGDPSQEIRLTMNTSLMLLFVGLLCIYVNYWSDEQKVYVRSKDGKCNVFGKPAKIIRAVYVSDNGKKKQSVLLVSGFWGISRHFHYIPEIAAAFIWTVPVHWNSFFPYFYVVYLIILLFDRANRDDERCLNKYGDYWRKYQSMVPYRVIPYIY